MMNVVKSGLFSEYSLVILLGIIFATSCRAETPREALERYCVSAQKTVLLDGYCPNVFANPKSRSTIYEIADSMDCDIENYYGFYLLRKRYAAGQDIPSISIDEMQASFRKMKQGFDPFGVNATPTPDEKASLTRSGVSIFAYRLADLVNIPKQEDSNSEWISLSKLGASAKSIFKQLDSADFIAYPANLVSMNVDYMKSVKAASFQGKNIGNITITRNDDKGDPFTRPLRFNAKILNLEPSDIPIETLGSWCKKETALETGTSFGVDAVLESKPIAVFGVGNSKRLDRMQAMAQLLGVKFRMTALGGNISPIYPKLPGDMIELPQYAPNCLPLAVRRAIMSGREPDLMARCEAILCSGWQRLATDENQGIVKLEDMNPIEKCAMAFYASGAGIRGSVSMSPQPSRLHEYIGAEDRVQIRVKYYTDGETKEPRRSLEFVATQPDGSKRELMTIANMRYR